MKRKKCMVLVGVEPVRYLFVSGLKSREFQTVWQKAKTICLECIGLG